MTDGAGLYNDEVEQAINPKIPFNTTNTMPIPEPEQQYHHHEGVDYPVNLDQRDILGIERPHEVQGGLPHNDDLLV